MADDADATTERLTAIQRDARSIRAGAAATRSATNQSQSGASAEAPSILRVLANVTLGAVVLLVVTGIHLFFYYRPLANLAGTGEGRLAGGTSGVGGLSELSRQLHVLAGWMIALGAVVGLLAWAGRRRRERIMLAPLLVGLFVAAIAAGRRAGWDDVAVSAEAPTGPTGFLSLFGDTVLWIGREGTEVSAASLVGWFALHLALAFLAAGLLAVAMKRTMSSDDVRGE